MTTKSDDRKAAFFALMTRMCQVGNLLPEPEDIDTSDAAQVAEVKVVLAEFAKIQAELDALLEPRQ